MKMIAINVTTEEARKICGQDQPGIFVDDIVHSTYRAILERATQVHATVDGTIYLPHDQVVAVRDALTVTDEDGNLGWTRDVGILDWFVLNTVLTMAAESAEGRILLA